MNFDDAYGPGIDLVYDSRVDQLKEVLVINSLSDLPIPEPYVLDDPGVVLELNFNFAADDKIYVSGAEWDKRTTVTTGNDLEVRDASTDQLVYKLKSPYAEDTEGSSVTGYFELKKSGNKLYISQRIPYQWLQTAVYPVYIDPTLTVDYNPLPSAHLINGTVDFDDDSVFGSQVDSTSGVSDNNDSTEFLVQKQTEGVLEMAALLYLKFDETSGNFMEDSGAGQINGTYNNSPNLTVSVLSGTGIGLDGIDDFAVVPSTTFFNLNSTEEFMFCFAINAKNDLPKEAPIFDYHDGGNSGWEVLGADPEIEFSVDRDGSGGKSMTTIAAFDDNLVHKVCLWAGFSEMRTFVNGSLDNTKAVTHSGAVTSTLNQLFVGTDETLSDFQPMDLDEFCMIKGENINSSAVAERYNETNSCSEIVDNQQLGQALTGNWNVTFDPVYEWFARLRKTTTGSQNVTVVAYDTNESINLSVNATQNLTGTGWFNINISNIMQHELNVAGLNFSKIRFWSEPPANFSEILLRQEVNDSEIPKIFGCQASQTNFECLQNTRLQCNVTDNVDVSSVNFTVDGVNFTTIQNESVYYLDYNPPIVNGSAFRNWTLVTASDILGNFNTSNPNISLNVSCPACNPVPNSWNNISCQASCEFNDDLNLGSGNLTFSGLGEVTVRAEINASMFEIKNSCLVVVRMDEGGYLQRV